MFSDVVIMTGGSAPVLEDLRIAREQKRSEGDVRFPMTDQTLRGSKVIQAIG